MITGTEFEWAAFWNAVVSAVFAGTAFIAVLWSAVKLAKRRWDRNVRPIIDAMNALAKDTNKTTKATYDTVNHGRLDRMEDQLAQLIDHSESSELAMSDRITTVERGMVARFDDVATRLNRLDEKISSSS